LVGRPRRCGLSSIFFTTCYYVDFNFLELGKKMHESETLSYSEYFCREIWVVFKNAGGNTVDLFTFVART